MTLTAAAPRADVHVSRRDADLLKQKVATITAQGDRPGKEARRTIVTENELNAFLTYDARPQLPVGVVDPSVTIVGTGRVTGRKWSDESHPGADLALSPAWALTVRPPRGASVAEAIADSDDSLLSHI